jgi:hypothetical protein
VDPEEQNDWLIRLRIDLDRCDAVGGVVIVMDGLEPIA